MSRLQASRSHRSNDPLIASLDAVHAEISSSQKTMLELIAEAEQQHVWVGSGARDFTQWLSIRYGISWWKADRWIRAARALERLPRLSEALRSGRLGIDKVVELSRFATPETESDYVAWASGVSVACIRRKADIAVRRSIEDVREADRARFLSWWYLDDGRRLGLEAELPAAEGAAVVRAIERLADRVPMMPGEEDPSHTQARRADALVALASASLASDADPDRAAVVVHAPFEALVSGEDSCEIEGGGLIHAETTKAPHLLWRRPDGGGGPSGPCGGHGADDAGTTDLAVAPAPPPRRGVPVPRVRDPSVHPSAPHRVGGNAAAVPIWTTFFWCAPSTTSWCTSTGGP
jgi:Domain of unknown function (DUF222)